MSAKPVTIQEIHAKIISLTKESDALIIDVKAECIALCVDSNDKYLSKEITIQELGRHSTLHQIEQATRINEINKKFIPMINELRFQLENSPKITGPRK